MSRIHAENADIYDIREFHAVVLLGAEKVPYTPDRLRPFSKQALSRLPFFAECCKNITVLAGL
jgi:hypothetical protein